MRLCDASSVGAAAAAALEQDPKEFVYVRLKEGPKELIQRCGLVSESLVRDLPRYRRVCGGLVVSGGL